MSSPVQFVKQEVLEFFADCRADAGHALSDSAFYHQRMSQWNPKQQDALEAALNELISEGLVESKGQSIFLTDQGVEAIYPDAGDSVREAILSSFADSHARAGHALNARAFFHQQMMSWDPKQKAALDTIIAQLVSEGLVEQRDGNLFLTAKGADAIY